MIQHSERIMVLGPDGFARLVHRRPTLEELLAEVARLRRKMPALEGPRTPVDDWHYPRRAWRP